MSEPKSSDERSDPHQKWELQKAVESKAGVGSTFRFSLAAQTNATGLKGQ